jgi:eukaryotic-like serine/threonine-protein kinase
MEESALSNGSPSAATFVGRARELAELRAGLDDAIDGRGRLFLLAGEPGIGKTRLADELARLAGARGVQVVWGRCWEGSGAPAYWPIIQVVRACVEGRDAGQVEVL